MMTMDRHIPSATPADIAETSPAASLWAGVTAWLETCAAYYAASAIYEQLSCLSDAELQRRGLSRETLAREVFTACDRRD